MSGVLVVDKPPGPTSFDVVWKVRSLMLRALVGARLGARGLKVGHGGTLDPMASGVLPVCLGEATKLAPFLLGADKCYDATVCFGVETDTLDAEGQVTDRRSAAGLTAQAIEAAMATFRGEIDQIPPMYSALKRAGRPLYDYARAGEEVERPPRRVRIHELTLEAFEPPDRARIRVRCSKGTYVRSLAADLGRALGPGAHLVGLRRTVSGPFTLAHAIGLDAFEACLGEGRLPTLVSLAQALAHLPAVTADPSLVASLRLGRRLSWSALPEPRPVSGEVRVLDEAGALVAVVSPQPDATPDRTQETQLRSLRVFSSSAGFGEPAYGEKNAPRR